MTDASEKGNADYVMYFSSLISQIHTGERQCRDIPIPIPTAWLTGQRDLT
jgi:hypothetical protein